MARGVSLLLLLAALVSAPACAHGLAAWHLGVQRSASTLGDWRLDIARDRFTGTLACRLRARDGRAFYMEEAVGFRFKPRWNVAAAVYRLDGGAPRSARDDLPALIAAGTPVDRGGIDNGSGGVVWVPYARLAEANAIQIEPVRGRVTSPFHFRGLKALHDIAIDRGCAPQNFVER